MHGVLLIVFVLTQDAAQPETQAFTAAAREVLGAGARVRVLTVPADLVDQEVAGRTLDADADGAIELSWTHDRSRALVHCYLAGGRRWVDRTIAFGEDDDARERGRMLGYAVASMFLSIPPDAAAEKSAARVSAPEPEPAKFADSQRKVFLPLDELAPAAAREESPSPSSWGAFDVGGRASHGLGGEADAVGVMAAFSFSAIGPLWARVGLEGRTGEIAAAQANMKTLQGSAGAAVNLIAGGRFSAAMRADLLGGWLSVGHLSPDDPNVAHRHRWLLGADAVFTGTVRLAAATSIFAGGGLEAMFGRTDIYTHGLRVATIPPLRLIAEVGLRSEF